MKEIKAFIHPHRTAAVIQALRESGYAIRRREHRAFISPSPRCNACMRPAMAPSSTIPSNWGSGSYYKPSSNWFVRTRPLIYWWI